MMISWRLIATQILIATLLFATSANAQQRDFRDYVNEECRPRLGKTLLWHTDRLSFWSQVSSAISIEREMNAGYNPCRGITDRSDRNRCRAAAEHQANWAARCYRLARQEIYRLRQE